MLVRWLQCDADHGWNVQAWESGPGGEPCVALVGPESLQAQPFTEAIASWGAATPPGSWIEIALRVRQGGEWSSFFQIARWDNQLTESKRTSFGSQRDPFGRVAVDTLVVAPSDAIQVRVLLYGSPAPELRHVSVALSGSDAAAATPEPLSTSELLVPPRSQYLYEGGSGWCSPTCMTMLVAYWYEQTADPLLEPYTALGAVPELAVPMCYDPSYGGTGNWVFNTAFAASLGMDAYVARFQQLADLAPWLDAGVPVVISVSWKEGQLQGAAIPKSAGHLLMVTGLSGDTVITADPAGASAEEVRRPYLASELTTCWQQNSQGVAYICYPEGWATPHG